MRFRLMVSVPEGERESQFVPPLFTEGLAVKLARLLPFTERVCDAGAAPPAATLKVRARGLSVIAGVADATVSFTATV